MTNFPKYMMATVAKHGKNDISSKVFDICYIREETQENYIGEWVTGIGFYGVLLQNQPHPQRKIC